MFLICKLNVNTLKKDKETLFLFFLMIYNKIAFCCIVLQKKESKNK